MSVLTTTTTESTGLNRPDGDYWNQRVYGLTRTAWAQIAVLGVLFSSLFWMNLSRLWQKTNPFTGEGNWEHAIFIPILGLYYLYVNSEELLAKPIRPVRVLDWTRRRWVWGLVFILGGLFCYFVLPNVGPLAGQAVRLQAMGVAGMAWGILAIALNWGIATMLIGIAGFAYGIYPGRNDYVKDLGMVITLFGVVLSLCGWGVMRVAWFPIVFLIFALPWPGLVYSEIATPLQQAAAWFSVQLLQLTGVESYYTGTKIIMTGHDGSPRTLNVAEACAGLKSLMTFLTVGAAMAFLSARPLWQKIIITLSAIPIAIAANTMRVAGQGLLDYYVSQDVSQGFAHQFSGLIMLIPAFFLLLLVGWILDRLFIEEVDEDAPVHAVPERSEGAGFSGPTTPKPVIIAPPPAGGSLRGKSGQ